MNTYGDELKRRRDAKKWTVREVASLVDRSPTYINDFEIRRKSNPPEPEMMRRLAEVLNWPVVEQLRDWGYAIGDAEQRANPFERDDPRWHYVETLKRFDLTDEYDAFVLVAAAKVLQLIDGDRALLADPLAGMGASPKRPIAQESSADGT
jgi:Helix-turn-helix.